MLQAQFVQAARAGALAAQIQHKQININEILDFSGLIFHLEFLNLFNQLQNNFSLNFVNWMINVRNFESWNCKKTATSRLKVFQKFVQTKQSYLENLKRKFSPPNQYNFEKKPVIFQ